MSRNYYSLHNFVDHKIVDQSSYLRPRHASLALRRAFSYTRRASREPRKRVRSTLEDQERL